MNIKLKVALICRSSEQGFAVPIALMLGLIMILLGSITIFKSQEENLIATTQRQRNRALAAAEVGVNQYQKLIDRNKFIAIKSLDKNSLNNWSSEPYICDAKKTIDDAVNGLDWQDVDSADASLGQYKLVSYSYSTEDIKDKDGNWNWILDPKEDADNNGILDAKGTLIVDGKVNEATARIEVEIPVRSESSAENIYPPALWLGKIPTKIGKLKVGDFGITEKYTPANILVSGTAGCKLSEPPPSTSPTSTNLYNSNTNIVAEPRPLNLTSIPIPTLPSQIEDYNQITASQLESEPILPRHGDKPDASTGNFYYEVTDASDLNLSSLTITKDTKVILYVQNKIIFDGDVDINDNNTSPYLEIYGRTGTTIEFKGDKTITIRAFIYAPDAQVTISDNPTVTIQGAMWVNDWYDTSSSNSISIRPDLTDPDGDGPLNGSESYLFYSIYSNSVKPITYPPTSWKTVEVN